MSVEAVGNAEIEAVNEEVAVISRIEAATAREASVAKFHFQNSATAAED